MARKRPECTTLYLLHILGKRWSIPIIEGIYSEGGITTLNSLLKISPGITPRGLSEILSGLSDTDIIRKSESRKKGVLHTKYFLTENGTELEKVIKSLKSFGTKAYGTSPMCKDRKCSECSLFSYCKSSETTIRGDKL